VCKDAIHFPSRSEAPIGEANVIRASQTRPGNNCVPTLHDNTRSHDGDDDHVNGTRYCKRVSLYLFLGATKGEEIFSRHMANVSRVTLLKKKAMLSVMYPVIILVPMAARLAMCARREWFSGVSVGWRRHCGSASSTKAHLSSPVHIECLSACHARRGRAAHKIPDGTWLTCGLSRGPVRRMHRLHSRATAVGPPPAYHGVNATDAWDS
jgi:hypothetical protein